MAGQRQYGSNKGSSVGAGGARMTKIAKSPAAKDLKRVASSPKTKAAAGAAAGVAVYAKARSNDKAQQKMISELKVKYDKSAAKKGGMTFSDYQKKYGK